jgi:hypothetical protein
MKEYNSASDMPNSLQEIWQRDFFKRIPLNLFQDAFFQDYTREEWESKSSK